MDIRYEQPLCGDVIQAMKFESGVDVSPGTLTKLTTGKLAAVAANDLKPVGFAMETKDVSETSDDYVQVIPFLPNHVYSVPAISGVVPGDPIGISGADALDEDAVNQIGMAIYNGGDSDRTYFVIVKSAFVGGVDATA